jgi:hypothetical protein
MPLTASEALVADLCRRSFLTFWSEPNPITRMTPLKELCDLLVVCSPHVIIFSVKEIEYKESGKLEVDWKRWQRRAVEASVEQIYGAERWIRNNSRVIRADGSPGLQLPPPDTIKIHRVAVALGGKGKVPYEQGDFGKGYVHVLDEVSLRVVLSELDTITDFVDYLLAKENLTERGAACLMEGQEEDLLAFYIHQGRCFPEGPDLLVVGDNLWSSLIKKPEWKARKEADRESYIWDGLIETLYELNHAPGMAPADVWDTLDGALGFMARETRFSRRTLVQGFNEFMRDAANKRTRARVMPSLSDVRYVFLASARDEDREDRRRELALRCFVARGMEDFRGDTVVGIATEQYQQNAGFSLDAVRITKPEWTKADQRALEGIQRDLGYFANPVRSRTSGDEFPLQKAGTIPRVGRNDPCPCGSGQKYKKCHGQT